MAKAFSYLRFSTPEQSAGDSYRRQTQLAERYAEQNGLDLDTKLRFEDLGRSAYRGLNVAEGALGAFLAAIKSGLVPAGSVLLVENLDRLSRSTPRLALRVLEQIVDSGVTVVTLVDNQTYTKEKLDSEPTSLFLSLLTFVRAHQESEVKSRRILHAWKSKRDNVTRKALTARIPSWLSLTNPNLPPPACFALRKNCAAVVKRIFQLTLEGTGQHAIAAVLNKEKVAPFGGAKYWHRSFVRKLLVNPAVVGTFQPHLLEHNAEGKKKRTPLGAIRNYFPPIIEPPTFNRVQALLKTHKPRGRHASAPVSKLLAGLVGCPLCQGSMTLVNKGSHGTKYLVCVRAKTAAGCKYHAVAYPPIETAFLATAGRVLPKRIPIGPQQRRLKDMELVLAKLTGDIGNLTKALARRPSAAVSQELAETEAAHAELQQQRDELEKQGGPAAQAALDELHQGLKESPINRAGLNALLRQLVASIILDYKTDSLIIAFRHGSTTELSYAK